jgi:hypothetical protein
MVLPSLEMPVRPVTWYFPPVFFCSNVKVLASICLIEMVSQGAPVSGYSLPSYLAVNPPLIGAPSFRCPVTVSLTPGLGAVAGDEFEGLQAEGPVRGILRRGLGLYQVEGRSAEPYALDGQYLIVGTPSTSESRFEQNDGAMVLAVDEDGGHYFKRMRVADPETIVLESLDLTGREGAIVFRRKPGNRPILTDVIPVLGVLFELPT